MGPGTEYIGDVLPYDAFSRGCLQILAPETVLPGSRAPALRQDAPEIDAFPSCAAFPQSGLALQRFDSAHDPFESQATRDTHPRLSSGDSGDLEVRTFQISNQAKRPSATATCITCSMSRRGNCYDNAVMESRFSTVKSEESERFESYAHAKEALFDYIEVFYNQRRRHSTLGQISPAEFERRSTHAA